MKHALISIKPRYVESIISGKKTVEIRRRRPSLVSGQWLWIYSTKPKACVVAVATINRVTTATSGEIWRRFGSKTAISKDEYLAYAEEARAMTAIELAGATQLSSEVSLKELKRLAGRFHPPQFFSWLEADNPVLDFFLQLISPNQLPSELSLSAGPS